MKEKWNERYASDDYIYGTEPNEFFRESIRKVQPGRLILPGEGEGRNAVWAAGQGWDVKAFDFSETAKQKALKLAAKNKVSFEYLVESWQTFSCRFCGYDAVGIFFFHLPAAQRSYFHQVAADWLKPGGMLIAEMFSKNQLGMSSGGPQDTDLLYSLPDLLKDFEGMEFSIAEEVKTVLNEGRGHKGEAWVIRLVGVKK